MTRGFPFRLWELVVNPDVAHEFLAVPECLLDEFSRLFLQDFNTVALLQSARCRSVLIAMGIFVRFEITRIECRHAFLRRIMVSSVTWKVMLEDMSARYLLLRGKLVQNMFGRGVGAKAAAASRGPKKYVRRQKKESPAHRQIQRNCHRRWRCPAFFLFGIPPGQEIQDSG